MAVAAFADDPEHRRVAGVKVTIADRPPVTWELALKPGQDPRLLSDGEFHGFGVDTGMGCLFDASAVQALAAVGDDDDEFERISDLVCEHAWAEFDAVPGVNCVAFLSGWGDGAYPVWVGRDADERRRLLRRRHAHPGRRSHLIHPPASCSTGGRPANSPV
ncbi:DUF4241 domain-containing protein [Microbispora sp. NPDC088329]|uniref:DUF4241 domain-containing protein n=1 Tax=Microbispora sp. NPDC088329 TaxID=3154869 RepID=UPI00343B08D0